MTGLDRFFNVAKRAALQAGRFLLNKLDGEIEVGYKGEGHNNPFSQVDTEAEDIILGIIGKAFPGHGFIAEEGGGKDVFSDYTWIIDPLDGTINFIHKRRYFGVSIALSQGKDLVLGVVYNPVADDMFTAIKSNGAYLNKRQIQVSKTKSLDKSLLGMGFPYDRDSEAFNRSLKYFIRLARDSQAVRRDGSTALSLCNVACGRYDGYFVAGNELWDYAAGTLIVAEAGGKVTDFKGEPFHIGSDRNEILATNGKIHGPMSKYLKDEEVA